MRLGKPHPADIENRTKETCFNACCVKPFSCPFLPAHERFLRRRRVLARARAQIPSGNPRRRGPLRRQVHQARGRQRKRVPFRLPARNHAGLARPWLAGRACRLPAYRGPAAGDRPARGGHPRHRHRRRLHRHHRVAHRSGRADTEVFGHLLHRTLRPVHGHAARVVLPHHVPYHAAVQQHHERRHEAARP